MVAPFIHFYGRCGEAIEFYERIFNIKNKLVHFAGDMPDIPENMKNWIIHAEMELEGHEFWIGDCFSPEQCNEGLMITLAVTFPTVEKVTEVFNKLLEGGSVLIELSPKPYSSMHGCVKDKFGIGWQILVR
jgi:PhnB protein